MARTKDPSAATRKAWITRARNAAKSKATTEIKKDHAKPLLSYAGLTKESPQVQRWAGDLYAAAVEREPEITSLVTGIAAATKGEPVGLKYRLKKPGAIASKIIREAVKKDIPPEEAATTLSDMNRYTVVYDAPDLVPMGKAAIRALEEAGWKPHDHSQKNWFAPGDAYDGYNATYTKDGVRFELQFHTPDTLEIKDKAHKLFEAWRELPDTDPSKPVLQEQMEGMWASYERPPGWETLPGRRMDLKEAA